MILHIDDEVQKIAKKTKVVENVKSKAKKTKVDGNIKSNRKGALNPIQ